MSFGGRKSFPPHAAGLIAWRAVSAVSCTCHALQSHSAQQTCVKTAAGHQRIPPSLKARASLAWPSILNHSCHVHPTSNKLPCTPHLCSGWMLPPPPTHFLFHSGCVQHRQPDGSPPLVGTFSKPGDQGEKSPLLRSLKTRSMCFFEGSSLKKSSSSPPIHRRSVKFATQKCRESEWETSSRIVGEHTKYPHSICYPQPNQKNQQGRHPQKRRGFPSFFQGHGLQPGPHPLPPPAIPRFPRLARHAEAPRERHPQRGRAPGGAGKSPRLLPHGGGWLARRFWGSARGYGRRNRSCGVRPGARTEMLGVRREV